MHLHRRHTLRRRALAPLAMAIAALCLLANPAAAAVELGTGTVNAGVSYYPTPGIACAATSVVVEGGVPENPTVVVGTGAPAYAGWWSFDGTGQSACETLAGGAGTLTITGNGAFLGNTDWFCKGLTGNYLREGTFFVATLSGSCTDDYSVTVPVSAAIAATWVWELNHAAIAGTITFTELA